MKICHFVVRILSVGVKHHWNALCYSIDGIRNCFSQEMAFRHECVLGVPHFLALIMLPIPLVVKLYLGGLWVLVIMVELLNTAIEAIVDLASPEWHELAKKSKDCASAAVFCMLILWGASWGVVLTCFVRENYK